MKSCAFMLLAAVSLDLSACGSRGSSVSLPPPTTYTIGGTVSGLSGSGLVLQNNGNDNLSVSANGTFTFATPMASGDAYKVTVLTPPSHPSQTCTITDGVGTATTKVTSVQVACISVTYTIGGTISGLLGIGLVLQDNLGDNLPITANGPFTFVTPIADGDTYNVTVLTQPTGPVQNCAVTGGGGIASTKVSGVAVACVTVTYTIGGTVQGLSGSGLELQDNSTDNLSVTANGGFAFSTPIATGEPYRVTVLTQPSSPVQNCTVNNSSGTASANVTNVQIVCVGLWTWVNGSNIINQVGSYGSQGMASSSNVPGARSGSVSWIDASGDFWLFGGYGYDSVGNLGLLNDLWKYSAGQWTWISGSNLDDQLGSYGTLGTASPSNTPGARQNAVGWTDASKTLWLFGGMNAIEDIKTPPSFLNDLWRYSVGEWTWMGGSNTANQSGTYGTRGTADPNNTPGARAFASGWTDASGALWLFGGGVTFEYFNDLWKYDAGEWTWMSGSNLTNQSGTYGTQGVAAPDNAPGGRGGVAVWIDAFGEFWVFGGDGFDSTGATGFLNDLWSYSAGEWTWKGGAAVMGQPGTYGTQGIASPSNVPGGREFTVSWTDSSGNLWLFGGNGLANGSHSGTVRGDLGDVWEYRAGQWIWVGGSNTVSEIGTYGSLGTASANNIPGSRNSAVGWTDASGNLWLFGGAGFDSASSGYLNDLWEYEP